MISDSGRRLANEMFKATRGRSSASTMNPQAQMNAMTQAKPGAMPGAVPGLATLDDITPPMFKAAKPTGAMAGFNMNNTMRQFGGV